MGAALVPKPVGIGVDAVVEEKAKLEERRTEKGEWELTAR
jgi:hypothetical protein